MADTEDLGGLIGSVEYVVIIIVATIGSDPVSSVGIVLTTTIWSSVFPDTPLPSAFVLLLATDWFLDLGQRHGHYADCVRVGR